MFSDVGGSRCRQHSIPFASKVAAVPVLELLFQVCARVAAILFAQVPDSIRSLQGHALRGPVARIPYSTLRLAPAARGRGLELAAQPGPRLRSRNTDCTPLQRPKDVQARPGPLPSDILAPQEKMHCPRDGARASTARRGGARQRRARANTPLPAKYLHWRNARCLRPRSW